MLMDVSSLFLSSEPPFETASGLIDLVNYELLSVINYYPDVLFSSLCELIRFSLIYDALKKVRVSETLGRLRGKEIVAENMVNHMFLVSVLSNFLLGTEGIYVDEIVLSAYTPDNSSTSKSVWNYYVELKVRVKNVDELIRIWDDLLEKIKAILGENILERIDIFLTRAY